MSRDSSRCCAMCGGGGDGDRWCVRRAPSIERSPATRRQPAEGGDGRASERPASCRNERAARGSGGGGGSRSSGGGGERAARPQRLVKPAGSGRVRLSRRPPSARRSSNARRPSAARRLASHSRRQADERASPSSACVYEQEPPLERGVHYETSRPRAPNCAAALDEMARAAAATDASSLTGNDGEQRR